MAKSNKNPKSNMLNEVKIVATRLAKPSQTTRLYPSGSVKNSQLDSISKANKPLAKLIGKPMGKAGEAKQYGATQSDLIKSAIKPKKKK